MELGLVRQIRALHEAGIPYHDVAVLYRNHKDAEGLIQYYTKLGCHQRQKRVDVLLQAEIKKNHQPYSLLLYGELEYHSQKHLLFEILHYDFWALSPLKLEG